MGSHHHILQVRAIRLIHMNHPARPLALILLAGAALLGGCARSGDRLPDPSVKIDPRADASRANEFFLAAESAERAGRPDEAINLYQQAVSAHPDFAAAWQNLGVLLMERGDGIEASSALRTAADLDPRDPRPLYNLGVLWQRRRYLEEASRYYEEALLRDPNHIESLRYSIYIDVLRDQADENTELHLKRALLIETDPQFKEWMKRQQLLVSAKLAGVNRTDTPSR